MRSYNADVRKERKGYMDIAGLSSVMSMEKLQMNVGYAMMAKVIDRKSVV